MGRVPFVFTALLLSVACAAHSPSAGKARLRVTADAHISELPATIEFRAFIEGGRNDARGLYCLDVVWDFRHVQYRDERDCDPYEPGIRIQRAFTTEHTFEREGVYDVEITLLQRGRPVLSASVEVQVRESTVRVRQPQ